MDSWETVQTRLGPMERHELSIYGEQSTDGLRQALHSLQEIDQYVRTAEQAETTIIIPARPPTYLEKLLIMEMDFRMHELEDFVGIKMGTYQEWDTTMMRITTTFTPDTVRFLIGYLEDSLNQIVHP